MNVTYIYHSSFLVETMSGYLLFDYFKGDLPELSPYKPFLPDIFRHEIIHIRILFRQIENAG